MFGYPDETLSLVFDILHLIFDDDPLFPDGKDFGDVSRQNVIMIVYLSKSHVVVKCWEMDPSAR